MRLASQNIDPPWQTHHLKNTNQEKSVLLVENQTALKSPLRKCGALKKSLSRKKNLRHAAADTAAVTSVDLTVKGRKADLMVTVIEAGPMIIIRARVTESR
jgi:hypothetical protein